MDLRTATTGDNVIVGYGAKGEQLATIIGIRRDYTAAIVQKWRANGRIWTRPLKVRAEEVLRLATDEDLRRFKPAILAR